MDELRLRRPGDPGALEADGEIESRSPATGEPIHVRFERGRPTHSEAVLFLADQSCCSRPNEDWCPNVNLFEDESLAMARSYTGG